MLIDVFQTILLHTLSEASVGSVAINYLFRVLISNSYCFLTPISKVILYMVINIAAIRIWGIICLANLRKVNFVSIGRSIVMSNIIKCLIDTEILQRILTLVVLLSIGVLHPMNIYHHNALVYLQISVDIQGHALTTTIIKIIVM